jgi:type I restriction enzyme S subunit
MKPFNRSVKNLTSQPHFNMREVMNIPRLRFPKFDENWEKKKLEDVGKIRMCKRIFNHQTSVSGDIPFFKIGTFGKKPDSFIPNELYHEFKHKYSYPKVGDILISASGTLGRTVVFDGSPSYFQDSNIVWIDNKENLITNEFLYYIYKIVRYESEGGTIQRLYNSIIYNAKFWKPSLPEQQKIADFLTSVDKRIELLEKKKTLLETYKKGVKKKIFNQEIRFKDDSGRDFPEWKKKKLVEFKELIHGDGDWILSKDITIDEKYKIIQLGSVGFGKLIQKDLKTVSQSSFEDIKGTLIEGGDLLINRMVDQKLCACIFNESSNHITSVDVCWIRENDYFDNYFLLQQILTDNYQRKLLNLSSGSGRVRISKKNLFEKVKFQFPCKIEQKKISNFLSKIDFKIELMDVKIDKSKTWKKGLLQKMFV